MVKRGNDGKEHSGDEDPSSAMFTAVNNNFVNAPPAKGALATLFRTLCREMNLGAFGWSQLMAQYLNNPANNIKNTPKDKATARGNLNKELFRDRLTWKVFMKAIRFFNPVRAEFTVRLKFKNGKTIESTVSMMDRTPKKRDRDVNPSIIPEDLRGLEKPDFPALSEKTSEKH